ncbi:SCAN domain-containing protein 3-like [Erpetoichthys calabaricus]|uniref:SCAN domain-containing protein 3-like n=1 Tax=Erpetoichthys calabaricus TaxID=27687 RepID=UPI0022346AE0|nr:SCAN domain-containing protein 3-like [Erpetoichthys calabaricus]
MSHSKEKRRKVDSENRKFNNKWTDKYAHIQNAEGKPMCLVCLVICSVNKEYNVRRHFKMTHTNFDNEYPPGSEARQTKIKTLTQNYQRSCVVFTRTCTLQQKATTASLRIAWILTKNKRPFTDSETVKECIQAAVEEVVTDEKVKEQVISSIKSIPLSNTTAVRRVDVLATDVFDTLLNQLRKADFISLAVDESTDNLDVAQLCMFVRFFDGHCFKEDILGLIPLEGNTTGEILFQEIVDFFQENRLDLERINLLVTDGAPSMAGKIKGLSARLSALAPKMKSLHCLIHQSVLCPQLSGELKNIMDSVMATINFIRSTSSLQHRLFRKLLADMSAEHVDLLLHNNVRWLIQGNSLMRVCELRKEIITFLRECKHRKAETFLTNMLDDKFVCEMCFLCDILHHLNVLNLGLQGRDKTVADVVERLTAFQNKLDIFSSDLSSRLLHFPTLSGFIKSSQSGKVTKVMSHFLHHLKHNFAQRFNDFDIPKELLHVVRNPFTSTPNTSPKAAEFLKLHGIDEGPLQLEMIEMQASCELKDALQEKGCTELWTKHVDPEMFPNMKKLAMCVLTMFGSTYTCESSFSHMNAIKTDNQISLTNEHLHHCLRIAVTPYEPNFSRLAQSMKCHFSH